MNDLTITQTHRTVLRLLPSSLEFLAHQHLAHTLPVLIDAGLVGCSAGTYYATEQGRRLLSEHERARAAARLRRTLERAQVALIELDAVERDLREQHNHDLGHGHAWTVRGAEVLTRTAREQVWSAICSIQAHLGIPLSAGVEVSS